MDFLTQTSRDQRQKRSDVQDKQQLAYGKVCRARIGKFEQGLEFPVDGNGGADGIRTHDLLDAIEARSQLRHGPTGDT